MCICDYSAFRPLKILKLHKLKVSNPNEELILNKLEKQMNQEWLIKYYCKEICTKDHVEICKLKHATMPLDDKNADAFYF